MGELELPNYLTKEQKEQVRSAAKQNKPILVTGIPGPTGKTTLANLLKANGIQVFEEWECEKIELNVLL